jgi:hypothetical protein
MDRVFLVEKDTPILLEILVVFLARKDISDLKIKVCVVHVQLELSQLIQVNLFVSSVRRLPMLLLKVHLPATFVSETVIEEPHFVFPELTETLTKGIPKSQELY